MLTRTLGYYKSAISIRAKKFGLALRASPPFLARSNQLIFLCGANRNDGFPSERRKAIKRFVEKLSADYRVIYAEGVFAELTKIGHNKNILDLEHEISDIADKILIVLESQSAFCELGAFAHQSFRKKLIIINDSQFRNGNSFINTGPIAAATEVKAPVLWYPMTPSGIQSIDGIGATFKLLKDTIEYKASSRSARVAGDLSDLSPTKTCLYFVHDLVLFTGPLSHGELVEVLIHAFGRKSYDTLRHLLAILRAAELIFSYKVGDTWIYRSTSTKPFMRYGTNVDSLMASFRSFHLRTHPERFCGV